MGKIFDRITGRREFLDAKRHLHIDRVFNRAGQASQVLLLLLGVFGYFYTVLPVYQKSLLDEEIAQKTLQIRDQEKQVLALSSEIKIRSGELASARREAMAARVELKSTYDQLKYQYSGVVFGNLMLCAGGAIDHNLTGSELDACQKGFGAGNQYILEKLKPSDAQLIVRLGKEACESAKPEFVALVAQQRARIAANAEKTASLNEQLKEEKAQFDAKAGGAAPTGYFSSQIKKVLELDKLRGEERQIKMDSYFAYRKLLEGIISKASKKFNDQSA